MSSPTKVVLPTLDVLGVKSELDTVDAKAIANEWLSSFAQAATTADVDGLLANFVEDGFWRDFLALTWEMRTFHGKDRIREFLVDRLAASKIRDAKLSTEIGEEPALLKPYADLAWIQVFFTFHTDVGIASGIARLVPNPHDGTWRAHTVFTNLEGLQGHAPATGPLRDATHFSGTWTAKREAELEFADRDPAVLIIGAGQSGLDVAARLKYYGVPTLLVDRNVRIGDQWRGRYESLCLHDPVWYDHLPYIPFPAGWPVWTPAPKLADWLESYAKSLDLNVWTQSTVTHTEWDDSAKQWTVKVNRNGKERVLRPRHVVVAIGLAGGVPNIPTIPGQDVFKGTAIHSTSFKSGRQYIGKKVLVIGACTSGHDVAADLHSHGVDVTIYQRSSTYIMSTDRGFPIVHKDLYVEGGPPADRADRILSSYPLHLLALIHQRVTKDIRAADVEIIQALEKVGFKCNDGPDGTGFWLNALSRGGGYYLDVGTSALVASGAIKLVSGTPIETFTENGVKFADGRSVEADLVVYATGFGDFKKAIKPLFGDKVVEKMKPVWGVDKEGEINSVWRGSGHPGLYIMMGNLQLCRFHSSHLVLQIKAMEENLYSEPYLK